MSNLKETKDALERMAATLAPICREQSTNSARSAKRLPPIVSNAPLPGQRALPGLIVTPAFIDKGIKRAATKLIWGKQDLL
jgi:hypothetical protein